MEVGQAGPTLTDSTAAGARTLPLLDDRTSVCYDGGMPDTMTLLSSSQWRTELGARLQRVRGERSVHSSDASGVGYRIIYRLEAGKKDNVMLDQLFMLCRFYGVSLAKLIDPQQGNEAGHWPAHAPSWPATDESIRTRLRQLRHERGMGVRILAKRCRDETFAGGAPVRVLCTVHPSWILRIESGLYATLDLVRIAAICGVLNVSPAELLPEVLRG